MRVWLVAGVIAVLVAAGVAAAVVVLPGGEGEVEGEVEGEAEAAPEVAAVEAEEPPESEVATPPEPVTLRYDRQDTTGAATSAGSYAFLEIAGDATSAITTFEYGYSGVVELRIHPTDASGISRAAFYDTVQVGDSFDYRTKGLDCGFRFKVTGVAAAATPRTFGIEYARSFGGWCDNAVDDASDAKRVQFVWRVPAGVPGPDGVREMLPGEAVGPGTYRVFSGARWTFDVPPGMTVFHYGPALNSSGGVGVMLIDVATDSRLGLDWKTGRETRRVMVFESPEVSALFDQIMASIRRTGGPSTPPEPVTFRYDRLDITGAATAPGSYAFLKTAGDATSAIENFGNLPLWGVELRVHPTDASGTSRTAFYDTVQVGDSFDYQTNRLACGFRFKVTSIAATASPRTFGIEYVHRYGGRCSIWLDDPGTAKDVHFVWKVPPGMPGVGRVRVLLRNEPSGPGTYRLHVGVPYIIDVPVGMQVIQDGSRLLEPAADAPPDAPRFIIMLLDAATGSSLGINPETGGELGRRVTSPEVSALFDQIMASIRRG